MKKLGIIKGGQLGRMLIQAAKGYPVMTFVLDPSVDAPCKDICDQFVQGDPDDFNSVVAFGRGVDILTFEYEHVNVDALEKLESESVCVYPKPRTLKIIQDKGLQKNFYVEKGIPTADFIFIDNGEHISAHLEFIPGVLKLRKHGYDGKGVSKVNADNLAQNLIQGPSILEKMIDFEKEISVIVARNVLGDSTVYPVVEMKADPEKNILDYLFSPANISHNTKKEAEEIALKIASHLDLVGVLAVEMFVTRDQKILVNEIAPRPHNTGHHTIEANETSQYEQLLRAVLGLSLGSVESRAAAAMVNLVGSDGYVGAPIFEGVEEILNKEGLYLHDYEKKETRPFRKMGHITILDQNVNKAREKAQWIKEKVKVVA